MISANSGRFAATLSIGAMALAVSVGSVSAQVVITSYPEMAYPDIIGGASNGQVSGINKIAQDIANEAVLGFFGGPELFVTGRVRTTNHDGFTFPNGGGGRTNPFEVKEASFFGSAAYSLPGTVIGASVRLTGLVGQTNLSSELKPFPGSTLVKGQIGSSDSDATMFGGSALFAWKTGWYAVGTVIGFVGQTDVNNPLVGLRASYDTSGWVGNLTVGHVIALTDIMPGLKLDLRGSAGYVSFEGDTFALGTARVTPTLSVWTASFQPMLFVDIPMRGGTLRPYVQGTIKGLGDYDNEVRFQFAVPPLDQSVKFGQHGTYWGAEGGINYGIQNWTFGAAIYTERSQSEETFGGKLGASYKFN